MTMSRLKERYLKEVVPELMKRFGYRNPMQVPKVEKIVINMGVGDAAADSKALDAAMQNLAMLSGQKPAITRAKKSVANFKIRQGMPIGCRVTLRGQRMYDFLDKLMNVSLPRIRDFRGVSPEVLRWARQLQSGYPGAADLSGDRLRFDRQDPGDGYHASSPPPRRTKRRLRC